MNSKRSKSLLIGAFILIISALGITAAMRSTAASTPSSNNSSYRPEAHGLPEVIAGYRILGVMTPENTACMPENSKRVVVQVAAPSVQSFLSGSPDVIAVRDELRRLYPDIMWGLAIVGPNATAEQIARGNPEWNATFADRDCIRLGGPIPSRTPRP
jgi:hypothetical protein